MSNRIKNLPAAKLLSLLTTMEGALSSSPNAYGVTAAEVEALAADTGHLADAVSAYEALTAAKNAAKQSKTNRKSRAATRASNLAKKIYANQEVTDSMLATLGLSPRVSGRTLTTPKAPLDVVVSANALGEVRFKWNRSGNSHTTIFVIQQWIDGQWISVYSTSRTRQTLKDFAPVETRFRVFAQVNGLSSPPSPQVVIWGGIESAGLHRAA